MIKQSILIILLVLLMGAAHAGESMHEGMDHEMMHGMKMGAFIEDSRI